MIGIPVLRSQVVSGYIDAPDGKSHSNLPKKYPGDCTGARGYFFGVRNTVGYFLMTFFSLITILEGL